jgi:hypothetical protein
MTSGNMANRKAATSLTLLVALEDFGLQKQAYGTFSSPEKN